MMSQVNIRHTHRKDGWLLTLSWENPPHTEEIPLRNYAAAGRCANFIADCATREEQIWWAKVFNKSEGDEPPPWRTNNP